MTGMKPDRRTGIMFIIAAVILSFLPCKSFSLEYITSLPDIPGWEPGETIATVLDPPSGNQGFWVEQKYIRKMDNHTVMAIILQGPGTAWSGLPTGPISADDGPIGSGATYMTTTVMGFTAVLESHPLSGNVLVVTSGDDTTFTFETSFIDVDLKWFAEEFLKAANIDPPKLNEGTGNQE